jgi:hypothetical protein
LHEYSETTRRITYSLFYVTDQRASDPFSLIFRDDPEKVKMIASHPETDSKASVAIILICLQELLQPKRKSDKTNVRRITDLSPPSSDALG